MVLAGGLGTRLGGLSERVPKSLIEVAGQPILSHILDWVSAQGCTRALVLIGHLGERFEDFSHEGVDIEFHKEKSPLGTGGALWGAKDLIEDRFVLLWGDDLHMIDYPSLLRTHNSSGCALTMTVTTSHSLFNLEHMGGRASPSLSISRISSIWSSSGGLSSHLFWFATSLINEVFLDSRRLLSRFGVGLSESC